MVCKKLFWSCLCCCSSSVLCGAPGACAQEGTRAQPDLGAPWLCPGSWKQLGPGCAGFDAQRSPPGAAPGSLQGEVTPCCGLCLLGKAGSGLCLGGLSHQAALSFCRGKLNLPLWISNSPCTGLLPPVGVGPSPSPQSKAWCVSCACVRKA